MASFSPLNLCFNPALLPFVFFCRVRHWKNRDGCTGILRATREGYIRCTFTFYFFPVNYFSNIFIAHAIISDNAYLENKKWFQFAFMSVAVEQFFSYFLFQKKKQRNGDQKFFFHRNNAELRLEDKVNGRESNWPHGAILCKNINCLNEQKNQDWLKFSYLLA